MSHSSQKEDIAMKLWKLKDMSTFRDFANVKKRSHHDLSSTGSDIEDEITNDDIANSECSDDIAELDNVATKQLGDGKQSKPSQSYIALIATAILQSQEKRLVLSDIYKFIMEKYSFFQKQDKSWRNSIRHNLSLNECFIKAGRSEQGKGHYWAIHPANFDDFSQGDFRRRRARRRVKRSFYDNNPYPMHQYLPPMSNQLPASYWYQRSNSQLPALKLHADRRYESIEIMRPQTNTVNPRKRKLSTFTIDSILDKTTDKRIEKHYDQNRDTCYCHYQPENMTEFTPTFYKRQRTSSPIMYTGRRFVY